LINALGQLNNDVLEIEELLIGGLNDDWPIEEQPDALFPGLDALDDDDDEDEDEDDDEEDDEEDEDEDDEAGEDYEDPQPRA